MRVCVWVCVCVSRRCESEERQTRRLEQQVVRLRETRARAEHTNGRLKADLWHSMTELEEMKEEFQVTEEEEEEEEEDADVLDT